ncbi:MAG TPA: glucose 1-dehydrogenase [Acidimicrobiales bacterium]|nr:glucose 1-dehydrogenase [Acidimicrobiales bacterium]
MAITIDLSGKTALVTGAGRGIGRAIARSLAAAGSRVAVAARTEPELRAVAEEIGEPTLAFVADLGGQGAPKDLADRVLSAVGRVDILVNNAGIAYTRRTEKADPVATGDVLRINLESALLLASALAPAMFDRGGCIVNVSSVAGVVGTPAQAIYAASKGGLDAATRSLACEWGPRGIRVNSVAPGLIITDMWERGRQQPGLADALEGHLALRRWGQPEDVANVVTFLASDLAAYVTGETILVDGGMARMFDVVRG